MSNPAAGLLLQHSMGPITRERIAKLAGEQVLAWADARCLHGSCQELLDADAAQVCRTGVIWQCAEVAG